MLMVNGYEVRDFRFPDNTIRLFPEDCELLQEIELINIFGTSGINNAQVVTSSSDNNRLFLLNGQPAKESYRGIIVKKGMKYNNR